VGSGDAGDLDWEYVAGTGSWDGELFAAAALETIADLALDDFYEENDTRFVVDSRNPDDPFSPNLGRLVTKTVITRLTLEGADQDWYKFRTDGVGTTAHSVRIESSNGPFFAALIATVIRENNSEVGYAFSDGSQVASLAGEGSGVYYVVVRPNGGLQNAVNYTLMIEPPPDTNDDAYEENDTKAQVDARPEGASNSPNLGPVSETKYITDLVLDDPVDWYKFQTDSSSNADHVIRLEFNRRNGDLALRLLRADGTTELATSDVLDRDFEEVKFISTPGATYYVHVYPSITCGGFCGGVFSYERNANYSLQIVPPAPSDSLTLSISSVPIVEGGRATATVARTNPAGGAVTVRLTSSNSSHLTLPATVTIPAGSASTTFVVQANDNSLADRTRRVTISATAPDHRRASQVVDIWDDEPPTVSITNVRVREGNSGFRYLAFTVRLSAPSYRPVQVYYATANGTARAGQDYTALSRRPLVFNRGETTKTIQVKITGDRSIERDETVYINLLGVLNAILGTRRATGTILNDD
jgi:hypothetical protein